MTKKGIAKRTYAKGKIKGYITRCPKCTKTALIVLFSLRNKNTGKQLVKCSACDYKKEVSIVRKS